MTIIFRYLQRLITHPGELKYTELDKRLSSSILFRSMKAKANVTLTVMEDDWLRMKYSPNTMTNKTIHHTIIIFFSMTTEKSHRKT